ncbi:pancreatic lipase-related protein 3-like [Epargyreus clarus]|uniref:pancreatic lipase-related protein 3-like n=1 Tax=Epargyreus clarus TaxID=520877 RepID=UPI003C2AD270
MELFRQIDLIYFYEITLWIGACEAAVTRQEPGKFSVSSILDMLPGIQPLVAAGSNRCESLKSFFGLTYEQMQEKNQIDWTQKLDIDLITKNENIKYNLTATKRLKRIMLQAKRLVILIHGFMESSDGWMVQGVAPELLKQPDLKLFALDGRRIINLEYFRSSTYAKFMGEKLGAFLSEMIKGGLDPSKISLIGHSLGTHIAGVAGKSIKRTTGKLIGRITALDPAGPCFTNVTLDKRLDRTDAEYVDVVHTNAGVLGLKEPVGHKDFYPNGGSSQPGCILSTCDHTRAWQIYVESIAFPNHFPARKCGNWTMFRDGLCLKNEVAYISMKSVSGSPGTYFLSTGSYSPYGLGPAGSG